MEKILKKYPYPICGLILGMATLGNLIRGYGEGIRTVIGLIATVMLVVLTYKILTTLQEFKTAMENPVIAGTFATYPMAWSILSTYYPKGIGFIVWCMAIVIHILLIAWFTKKFVLNFDIKKVFTTWFIVYVGIVTVTVTSLLYGQPGLGRIAFWLGFVTYLSLLGVVCYRCFIVKNIPEPAQPTLVVFAAPASLLLAGYMASSPKAAVFPEKNQIVLYLLLFLSVLFFVYGVVTIIRQVKLPFYPSYAAYTFPTAVSALALKLTAGFFAKAGVKMAMLPILVKVSEVVAIIMVSYVFVKFMQAIFSSPKE